MGLFLEYPTLKLSPDEFRSTLEKCKQLDNFKAVKNKIVDVKRRCSQAFDIAKDYDVCEYYFGDVNIDFKIDFRNPEELDYFLSLVSLAEGNFFIMASILFDHQKRSYDPDRERELTLFLRLAKENPFFSFSINVSRLSDGWKNSEERVRIFNKFLRAIDRDKEFSFELQEGLAQLQVSSDRYHDQKDEKSLVINGEISENYLYFFRLDSWENSNGVKEISKIVISGFDVGQDKKLLKNLLNAFDMQNIYFTEVDIKCKMAQYYEHIMPALNKGPVKDFTLSFSGRPRFQFSEINDLMASKDEFSFEPFTIKPKGMGLVNVGVEKRASDDYRLEFRAEYRSEKQRIAMEKMILDLFDGRDMVDWDVIV